MAEFCWKCSKKLGFDFDGFYEGEICEQCGIVKRKNLSIFSRIIQFLKQNNMKKTLLLLMLTVFSVKNSSAQVKTIEEVDKFTKNKVVQVNAMKGKRWGQGDSVSDKTFYGAFLSFKSNGGLYYLQVNTHTNGLLCISNESLITLLFEDESTINLINNTKVECSRTELTGKYLISEEQLNTLATDNLQGFRVYYTDGYRDYNVKNDKKEIIKKSAELFLQSI